MKDALYFLSLHFVLRFGVIGQLQRRTIRIIRTGNFLELCTIKLKPQRKPQKDGVSAFVIPKNVCPITEVRGMMCSVVKKKHPSSLDWLLRRI